MVNVVLLKIFLYHWLSDGFFSGDVYQLGFSHFVDFGRGGKRFEFDLSVFSSGNFQIHFLLLNNGLDVSFLDQLFSGHFDFFHSFLFSHHCLSGHRSQIDDFLFFRNELQLFFLINDFSLDHWLEEDFSGRGLEILDHHFLTELDWSGFLWVFGLGGGQLLNIYFLLQHILHRLKVLFSVSDSSRNFHRHFLHCLLIVHDGFVSHLLGIDWSGHFLLSDDRGFHHSLSDHRLGNYSLSNHRLGDYGSRHLWLRY